MQLVQEATDYATRLALSQFESLKIRRSVQLYVV